MRKTFAILATFLVVMMPGLAHAAEGLGPNPAGNAIAIAIGLSMGLAALGGTLGQGRAVAAALEGICRNPNSGKAVFTPMLLGLAFIESLVIFAMVISFILNGHIEL